MGKSRYWIYDREDSPMGFPLGRLVQALQEHYPYACTIEITMCWGYGEQINTWDGRLDAAERVEVDIALLQRLCTDGEEWFYDLDVVLTGYSIRFGLHDSTALFVEGERALVEPLTGDFLDVRINR